MIHDLSIRIKAAIDCAHADAEFVQATSGLPCEIRLIIGLDQSAAMFDVLSNQSAALLKLSADASTWNSFTQTAPPVGYHSFTAAIRDPLRLSVEGESLHIAQSLHALERFFEILRGQIEQEPGPHSSPALENVTGHYADVGLAQKKYPPIYYERAGTPGCPTLLMLHTAGADSRQYHHILADPQLQAAWDMYVFDLPAHGKSMPSPDSLWQGYQLDKLSYSSICLAFIENVIKKPTVLLGCSMGAAMALHLGNICPAQVAAIVALETPYKSRGRRTAFLAHPQVNQAGHNPSYVRGLMSPTSPLHRRRAAAWIYSQGGFQVYPGDLAFYSDEFDAEVDIKGLDARKKAVYLLTGSYDYSASPADSKRVADLIPGARFMEMPDLGHFPMIENPDALLVYLRPVLQEIKSRIGE